MIFIQVLIIGGSIANFTNVAKTFKGIVRALEEFKLLLEEHNVTIYVRRGGPNYQEGLRTMKAVGGWREYEKVKCETIQGSRSASRCTFMGPRRT